jgi:hypothetical protein
LIGVVITIIVFYFIQKNNSEWIDNSFITSMKKQ